MIGLQSQPTTTRGGPPSLCRALDPEVGDAVWAGLNHSFRRLIATIRWAVTGAEPLTGTASKDARAAGTGCSWEDAERLCGNKVSDTTAGDRRDEWIKAGVFTAIAKEAIAGYDKIIGLDLSDVAVDGSLHKSPAEVRERARIRRTEPSSDGSGRSSPTETASPSAGPSTAPIATTR